MTTLPSAEAPADYEYVDSLHDLLDECRPEAGAARCAAATALGVMSAYALPVMLTLTLISNGLLLHVFAVRMRLATRFAVYLSGFCIWDSIHALFWGLGWFHLAKGLPYATGGAHGFLLLNAGGDVGCRTTRFAQSFLSGSAALVLLAYALDRCLSVLAPMRMRGVGRNRAAVAVLAATSVSLVLSLISLAMFGRTIVTFWPAGGPANATRILCGVLFEPPKISYYVSMLFRLLLVGDASLLVAVATLIVNLVMSVKVALVLRRRKRQVAGDSSQRASERREDLGPTVSVILMSIVYLLATVPKVIGVRGMYGAIEAAGSEPVETRLMLNIGDIGELLLQWTGALNALIVFRYVAVFRRHLHQMAASARASAATAAGRLACSAAAKVGIGTVAK